MADESFPRRRFLPGVGALGTTVATVLGTSEAQAESAAQSPSAQPAQPVAPRTGVEPPLTLTATEADFLSAALTTADPEASARLKVAPMLSSLFFGSGGIAACRWL